MLPLFAVVKIAPRHGRAFRLWLPLFLVWMLLVVLGLILVAVDHHHRLPRSCCA